MPTNTLRREAPQIDDQVTRAQEGDMVAFEALYREHRARVFGLCLRWAQDREVAEGWAQEVWVRVWEKLGSFRGESAFSSWLHRLAVNLALDRKRSAGKEPDWVRGEEADVALAARAGPEGSGGTRMDLQKAVASLPEGARTVFLLHDVEGFRHREIADRLGVAEGTVKAQLFRARRLLREALNR